MFTPLNLEEVEEIVHLQVNALKASLAKKDIKLELSDALISHLAKIGFEPQFGARPIKRVIQRVILNQLSKEILSGRLLPESAISIDLEGEKLVFNN